MLKFDRQVGSVVAGSDDGGGDRRVLDVEPLVHKGIDSMSSLTNISSYPVHLPHPPTLS